MAPYGMARNHGELPPLGELELELLELLWTRDDIDVRQAHDSIGKARNITANTVGSALERLYKKGLLSRYKQSHAYRYQADISRDEFRAQKLIDAAGGLRELSERGLLVAFVDLVADADTSALDELERLVKEKRES